MYQVLFSLYIEIDSGSGFRCVAVTSRALLLLISMLCHNTILDNVVGRESYSQAAIWAGCSPGFGDRLHRVFAHARLLECSYVVPFSHPTLRPGTLHEASNRALVLMLPMFVASTSQGSFPAAAAMLLVLPCLYHALIHKMYHTHNVFVSMCSLNIISSICSSSCLQCTS